MALDIIGLSGNAGSGKDFIATNYLKPLGYHSFSFAFHFKVWLIGKGLATYEEVFVTKPPHVRKLLQEEGTERGRLLFGENVWIDTAFVWMRLLHEQWGINKFVIPDVRFPNEADAIQDRDGRVYRIIAEERVAGNGLSESARQHPSETALNNYYRFTGHIYNDPIDADSLPSQIRDKITEYHHVE